MVVQPQMMDALLLVLLRLDGIVYQMTLTQPQQMIAMKLVEMDLISNTHVITY